MEVWLWLRLLFKVFFLIKIHQNYLKTQKIYQFEAKKKIKNFNFFQKSSWNTKTNRVLRNLVKKTCKNYCTKAVFQTQFLVGLTIQNTIWFIRGDHFRFGLVFIKKSNKIKNIFLKKMIPNRNWFKPTGFGWVRFGFLEEKPIQTGLARFWSVWLGFSIWLGFFGLTRFFPVFSVRFGFFIFRLIKPKPNH